MGGGVSLCNSIGLKRRLTIIFVGLDNAGKTCASRALAGESIDSVTPTVGFSKYSIRQAGVDINIYDLGGGSRIREIWKNYFAEAHGIVYVVDASDSQRVKESQQVLTSLMTNEVLKGKPLLLLANKQDNEEALDEIDLSERMHLEKLANECQTPTRIEICSAVQGKGKNVDPTIKIGFQWLVECILEHFDKIQQRVSADVAKQRLEEEKEREERRERIKQRIESNESEVEQVAVTNTANKDGDEQIVRDIPSHVGRELQTDMWNLPGSVEMEQQQDGLPVTINPTSSFIDANPSETILESGQRLKEDLDASWDSGRDSTMLKLSYPDNNVDVGQVEDRLAKIKSLFGRNNRTVPLGSPPAVSPKPSDSFLPPLKRQPDPYP